jgi:hypothetical protein
VTVASAFSLNLTLPNFLVRLENSDGFINLVSVTDVDWSAHSNATHGLLGQSWKTARQPRDVDGVDGWVDDYAEADNNLLGRRFAFDMSLQSAQK